MLLIEPIKQYYINTDANKSLELHVIGMAKHLSKCYYTPQVTISREPLLYRDASMSNYMNRINCKCQNVELIISK